MNKYPTLPKSFFLISEPTCPSGYSHMGQLSDGRTCYASPGTSVSASTNTCPKPTEDLLRKPWMPSTPYEVDWFRRAFGLIK